ncbi:MAG: response regulator [Paracoccaceae bacterium]
MALRRHLSVLVVDDMAISRQIMCATLESIGIAHVSSACDGRAALDRASRRVPDLVLSDLHMPGMDGVALLAAFRAGALTASARFIVVTGLDTGPRLDEAWRLGLDALLLKPFDRARLLAVVEQATGRL